MTEILVPRRFCGPPSSGNGGWSAGALAAVTVERDHADPVAGDHRRAAPAAAARHRAAGEHGGRLDRGVVRRQHGRPRPGGRPGAHRGPRGSARGRAGGDGGLPRLRLAPVPDLLHLRHRPRGGRRAADLPGRRGAATSWAGWPRRGRRTRAWPRTGTPTRNPPATLAPGHLGGARLRRRLVDRHRGAADGARHDHACGWTPCRGSARSTSWSAPRAGSEGRKTYTAATLYDSAGAVVATAEHVWITVDPADVRLSRGPPRERLVAGRRRLPGLRPQLRRLRRRRHRRPARHHRPAALPARPRRRRGLDHAVLPVAAARPRLRRRRLPRRRPAVRHARRRRRAARPRPRARAAGDRRPGAQPHLERAPVVPGGAGRRAGERRPGPLPVPHRPRRTARSRRTTGARSSAGRRGPGSATPTSGTSTCSTPPSPTSTGATPTWATLFDDVLRFWLDRGVDGFRVDVAHGLVKEEACATRSSPRRSRPRPRTAEHAGRADRRRADVGPARGARDLPALAPDPRRVRRRPDGRRRGLDPDRRRRWRATCATTSCTRRSTSTGCWPTGRRPSSAGSIDETLAALGRGRRRADLGAQQPRRTPAPDAVRRRPDRPGPGPRRDAGVAGAARVGVPLPGRGARPRGRRRRARAPAGPVLVPHRQARPGRLPGADPVGGRPAAVRLRAGQRPAVDPAAGRLGGRSRSRPSRPTRTPRWRSTGGRSPRGASTLADAGDEVVVEVDGDVLTLRRGELTVVLNCGATPVPMPPGELLIASGPVDDRLPPDTAVWVRTR